MRKQLNFHQNCVELKDAAAGATENLRRKASSEAEEEGEEFSSFTPSEVLEAEVSKSLLRAKLLQTFYLTLW